MSNNLQLIKVYIGIGSNLEDPRSQIQSALGALKKLSHDNYLLCSSIYQSEPMGDIDQPDYLNAVVCIHLKVECLQDPLAVKHLMAKSALSLLDKLQQIEQQQGRVKKQHWDSRTVDLDLLIYHNAIINESRLTVPHYGLKERNFVIVPLAEIAPELILPEGTSIKQLVSNCSTHGINKIESS